MNIAHEECSCLLARDEKGCLKLYVAGKTVRYTQ